jgi:hypothetical protein
MPETTALATRDARDPAKASGRLRRAAEHYVKSGFKAIGPSLVWAGYSKMTAREPTKNGYTHDWMLAVARYWSKGSQMTAQAHLSKAIAALGNMVDDPSAPHAARGAAAKIIIDVAGKEKEGDNTAEVRAEEQAKWMSLIRHWKRTFLRRGIMIGMGCGAPAPAHKQTRAHRLLAELNYVLGKGEMPDWMEREEDLVLDAEVIDVEPS